VGDAVSFFSRLFGGGSKGLKVVDQAKRWDLRGRTGQGSMSKVYQAYDREIGRTVCLKLLDKVKTQKFEERFKGQGLKKPSEGEICVGLSHINCVKTYEHGVTTKGDPYLVMEWIEGRGLNFLIETRNAQFNGKRVNYVMQLCDAIDYLHSTKYLHRDLCPRNVMVDTEGVVKLIDFGLTIPYTPEFCQPGNRTGTADYLAPEIIKRMTTDSRVDLFALGVTAFEIFTHQLPWERTPNSDENLRRRLNSAPRRPKDLNPNLDDDLVAILNKSIERDKNLRFKSAKEMKEAFEQLSRKDY
jgi:eukaryotic-like serine/threonine-protein kinase